MSAGKIIVGVVGLIYAVILVNIIYYMVQTKAGLAFPVWIQIVLGVCFLFVSVSNWKAKHYIFGSLFASAVILIAASVIVTSVFG
ncbi:hypothetical protein BMT55_01315 [Listeria newyorkensis]|uniref:Uncharacterized protein n=1 Tax=Listeria newyorkensis TaxID=1497681 RepID=A0ABX4XSM1_9LIST|nr:MULTISPECIES: hypothetical protein [Listeria]KGL39181.1 hypothetical protein EP56_14835 [Listeriaceae bacterium FSL A5-0209]KGL43850.1 hypothetical protein EP58_05165 [Listeria newyorkensis]KMT61663.1 hypothetical protein X559_1984 [Listeria newyorkensis]PNP95016.1 hypothetical protein BMT55_01315 [Listeria newyorkensis]RQW66401.1 hypothetical protein DUK53_11890 [Listeria sp. SHR_NRA_18]